LFLKLIRKGLVIAYLVGFYKSMRARVNVVTNQEVSFGIDYIILNSFLLGHSLPLCSQLPPDLTPVFMINTRQYSNILAFAT
jgi:hypothetical protein